MNNNGRCIFCGTCSLNISACPVVQDDKRSPGDIGTPSHQKLEIRLQNPRSGREQVLLVQYISFLIQIYTLLFGLPLKFSGHGQMRQDTSSFQPQHAYVMFAFITHSAMICQRVIKT